MTHKDKDGKEVDYDVIPFPPDFIMVEVPRAVMDERLLEMSPLYIGIGLTK